MQTKLILPTNNGVPNLEVRRLQREIEEQRAKERGIHQKTADEICRELDKLRAMAERGEIRALTVVALLRTQEEMPQQPATVDLKVAPMSKVLFACPRQDHKMAWDLANSTVAFVDQVMRTTFSPPSPDTPAT